MSAETLTIVKTIDKFTELMLYLKDKEYIAFDTETTGLDKESEIIGFSVCADVDQGFYVILSEWDKVQQKLIPTEVKEMALAMMLALEGKNLVMHNAVFDCNMVRNNYGIDLMPYVHTDTMLLAHVTDENRSCGLKDLGVSMFGENASKEAAEMKASVMENGGSLTKANYEMYKADSEIMARYGAKDAILTLKLFWCLLEDLYEQELDTFFYEETMPLLRGPTYQLNNDGLKVDQQKLEKLRVELETECMEAKAFIYKEITPLVKDKYPGTGKTNTFNIGSTKQMAWLLFFCLPNEFCLLTKEGKELCKALGMDRLPYSFKDKSYFIELCKQRKGTVWQEEKWNPKKRATSKPKKVTDPWNYMACGKETLLKFSHKYKWVDKLLEYSKNQKILNTYVLGIQERIKYGVINPSFLQHGTTSGRYSSRNPNFQNLPRNDKRVKSCIVSRPGMVFVGADYAQLEPRVFASFSGDERLIKCFKDGDDFYSVIGVEVFDKHGCSLKKDDKNSFAKLFPELRDISKVIALSATYGTTAPKMSPAIGKSMDECQEIIDGYFEKFPSVRKLMLDSHEQAKSQGYVTNLFGRKRRMPKALVINEIYGNTPSHKLPYEVRNLLNLAINHRIQSTGASIMNRAAIEFHKRCLELGWKGVVKIVMQIHDEMVVECPENIAEQVSQVLKEAMEGAVTLPNVALITEPKIGRSLSELK